MEFATGALGTLLPKLGQLLKDEYNLHKGVKKDIELLTRELESMHAALRNVGEVPPEQLSELVKIWARSLRELSYDMEDIVDTFLVNVQGTEPSDKRSAKRFIKNMMNFLTKAKIQNDIAQEIMDIRERVKEVAERRDRYRVDDITPAKTFTVNAITPAKAIIDPRIASLYTNVADLVGIDETREELIMRLTEGDDDMCAQQSIVSIVGFGGLGKTTLAKAVYDKLKGQSDCAAFVPVGRNPNLKKVFKDILIDLHKLMPFGLESLDERQLIDKLQEFLKNKRYFLVIDDVWDTYSWGIIKLALIENNSGSRIIVTTRTHEVATEAGQVYKLHPLSDDNSRKLFIARIFAGESKASNHQSYEVSDWILRKCDGIPLAIITMASLLVGKPREQWSEVHRSINFGNKENRQVENTMKILSFSYYDLPSHLRTCLLHLSVFPEDYFIAKRPLIWAWIAEGFVHERQGISSFEIGEGYFNELLNRSMIQPVEEGEGAEEIVCGCRLHDMVLDLIRSISSEENFVTVLGNNEGVTSSSQGKIRRLSLQNNNRTLEACMKMQQVRSFISYGCDIGKGIPLSCLKLVRVLAIHSRGIKHRHLRHLQNLLHLRYLHLNDETFCGDGEFIEQIGTLKFLQTLIVDGMKIGSKVVTRVGLLTQLLCLRFKHAVDILPDGIGKLTSLEELKIRYGGYSEKSLRRFVKELGSLRELRVLIFEVLWMDVDRVVQIEMVESLRNLEKMEHLSLVYFDSSVPADTAAWEAAGFLLPRHLRRLSFRAISFTRFPSLCINPSRLPLLSHLFLRLHDMDEQGLRILGELPELRDLELQVLRPTTGVPWIPIIGTTDSTGDGYLLFQKLRRCSLWSREVGFLLSTKDESGGSVSLRVRSGEASMILGSEWKGVCSGIGGVTPTLMPSAQKLDFTVRARGFKNSNDNSGDWGSLDLEYFASVKNVRVEIDCEDAAAAEVEEVEAALRRAAEVHPNRPILEMLRDGEGKMISAPQD
ncbi:unnamed protein product [Urochloa decumbens]